MLPSNLAPLERLFSEIPASTTNLEEEEINIAWGLSKAENWETLEKQYRCVVLAEAGAGKSVEMESRALRLQNIDQYAFFIRIEDIDQHFNESFEVGDKQSFDEWLKTHDEAWFFLDSVDEARLSNPRAFEKAIRRFANTISTASHRAHVFISSRPYAWRSEADRQIIEHLLPFTSPIVAKRDGFETAIDDTLENEPEPSQSSLKVFVLRPLDRAKISQFARHRNTPEVESFIGELERMNLMDIAGRPLDLDMLLTKWKKDGSLGGRFTLISESIDKQLTENDADRAPRQPLSTLSARRGARALAAAVVMTGKPGIRVPDSSSTAEGIDPKEVLEDWSETKIRALLERSLFNDIIYGMVRFRHRDIREFLAAEWLHELLQTGNSRAEIMTLMFREQYGLKVITPRLRPLLAWLSIRDTEILNQVIALKPEIVVDGGDAAELPLHLRRRLLADIVSRIANDKEDSASGNNDAIARIAQQDLSEDVIQLISDYSDNDDAIFYLGRLVWQGQMHECLHLLRPIALDPARGIYARIASARAIMTCGTDHQKRTLWNDLNACSEQLPRRLLAEVVRNAEANSNSVEMLSISIEKLTSYEKFETTGLNEALQYFIERLPLPTNDSSNEELMNIIDCIVAYLGREPYIEREECRVSEEFKWLLEPATHAVQRLVEARNPRSFDQSPIAIMSMTPKVRFWRGDEFKDRKNRLAEQIPGWTDLNDYLFWQDVVEARRDKMNRTASPLTDAWEVMWREHFWKFELADFERVIRFLRDRDFQDDKLIALTLAYNLLGRDINNEEYILRIRSTIDGDAKLTHALEGLISPSTSTEMLEHENRLRIHKQEQAEKCAKRAANRSQQIEELRANPALLTDLTNLKPGEMRGYQYNLLQETYKAEKSNQRSAGANWESLIEDYGLEVAQAYKTGAIAYWRRYSPALRSEGFIDGGKPWALIFAMTGLEIEARENKEFPNNLNEHEAKLALRYITWELNGFPRWLEKFFSVFPAWSLEAIEIEIDWELNNSDPDKSLHYILHDVAYSAPWLHKHLVILISHRLERLTVLHRDTLRYCLQIISNGGAEAKSIATLASAALEKNFHSDCAPTWFAVWIVSDPDSGIPALVTWLSNMSTTQAKEAAESFVTTLFADFDGSPFRPGFQSFRNPEHLKKLYLLMYENIRPQDDIDHSDGEAYWVTARDDAQKGRDRLLSLLCEIPGKETYLALRELIQSHPDPQVRSWMERRAFARAEEDADLEPWTAKQVREFETALMITPQNNQQLYDLTCNRLADLKDWLENGNSSPFRTWQKVDDEAEMRNLIAGWLNQNSGGRYVCAQENELPNAQRPDIWIESPAVDSPVPIELKLLDKGWSGPSLCERLRNQLAGDYMREKSAVCGIFLLIWCGRSSKSSWEIDRQLVRLAEMEDAIKTYWDSISPCYPSVEAIKVMVIDLTKRSLKSK